MTTIAANVAPKLSALFSGCFKKAMDKKKKIAEGGAEPVPAAGSVVATSSNLTKGDFSGSMEQTRELVKNALITDGRYGKYPYIIATYDDHVFVESDSPSPQPTRFFTVPYKIENGAVKLTEPTEVEKITKFVVKEIAESILKDLLHE
jgi:hypothetical protein